jgi:hypothetical protein
VPTLDERYPVVLSLAETPERRLHLVTDFIDFSPLAVAQWLEKAFSRNGGVSGSVSIKGEYEVIRSYPVAIRRAIRCVDNAGDRDG